MEKFLKENKYAAATAIKVISYAILNNKYKITLFYNHNINNILLLLERIVFN